MMRISKNVLNYSITTKILFLTGITTIVCIAFIIGFIGVNTYATLIGVYERNLHLDAEYYTQSIESSVNTVSDKLKTLALVHEVNDIDYENKKFTAIAENLLSGNSQFIEVFVIHEDKNTSENKKVGYSSDNTSTFRSWFRGFVNPDEAIFTNRVPFISEIDDEVSRMYKEMQEDISSGLFDRTVIGEPRKLSGEDLIIDQMVPIVRDGEFLGAIGIKYFIGIAENLSHGTQVYDTMEYLLLSKIDNLIFSSEEGFSHGKNIREIYKAGTLKTFLESRKSKWKDVRLIKGDVVEGNYFYVLKNMPLLQWQMVMRVSQQEIIAPIQKTMMKGVFFAGAGIVIICMMLLWLAKTITRPIKTAVDIVKKVAEGDLTVKAVVTTEDELGELLNSLGFMSGKLNSLLGRMKNSGTVLTDTAVKLSEAAKVQRGSIKAFGKYTGEIVASASQISATSKQLANTMTDVASLTADAANLAGEGKENLSAVEDVMNNLKKGTVRVSDKLSVLECKASNISNVVVTISNVSNRTNLLSLNAAIEAEKAGEYGLGFAVVATEIRRLADQTTIAAQDIEYMIKEVQAAITSSVSGMNKFAGEVRGGLEEIEKLGKQFSTIIQKVEELKPSFDEVSDGMCFQSKGAQQINEFMLTFIDISNDAVGSLSKVDNVVDHLNKSVADLGKEVSLFKLN